MKQFRDTKYLVTENGEVFNGKRFLKIKKNNQRYFMVGITISFKNRKTLLVHRMVAECYIPNPNNLPQVNHIDGNRYNNHYTNLEWCSASQNVQHSHDIGISTVKKGSLCNFAKLREEDIPEIKRLYKEEKLSQYKIAQIYNVRQPAISRIINDLRWSHLNE